MEYLYQGKSFFSKNFAVILDQMEKDFHYRTNDKGSARAKPIVVRIAVADIIRLLYTAPKLWLTSDCLLPCVAKTISLIA